jgi:hypothetical protein
VSSPDLSGVEQEIAAHAPAVTAAAGPNWQDQDSILRELWMRNQPPAAIAKELGRSVPAIMTRAARLGLPRRFAPGRKPGRRPAEKDRAAAMKTERSSVSVPASVEAMETAPHTAARICLMCLNQFQSMGRHNRICPTCKNSAEYDSGSRLPDLEFTTRDF